MTIKDMRLSREYSWSIVIPSMVIFVSSIAGNFILFLVNLYLSNIFGPSSFGTLKTILYLFTFLAVTVGFGFQPTLARYISFFHVTERRKINYLIKWYFKLMFISALLLASTVILLRKSLSLILLHSSDSSPLLIPSVLIIFSPVINLFSAALLGYKKFHLYAIVQTLIPLLIAATVGVMKNFGLLFILFAWPIGIFLGNIPAIIYVINQGLFKYAKKFDVKEIFTRFGFPIYVLRIVTSITSLIVPIISVFVPRTVTGYYSFAFIFYNATLLFPSAISSVLLPKVSELNAKRRPKHMKKAVRDAFKFHTLFVIGATLFLVLFSEQFILFISPSYLGSLLFFRYLSLFGIFSGYITIYNSYLLGIGKVKHVTILTLLQSFFLFTLTFLLLWFFNATDWV